MTDDVNSVFGIRALVGSKINVEDGGLERFVVNDFDAEEFRKSLELHRRNGEELKKEIVESSDSVGEFNEVIKRVSERGRGLRPFNNALVRALRLGNSRILSFVPFSGLLTRRLRGYSTEELVTRYCEFFSEQAEDFGYLFFHVVEREAKLVDYSNELIRKSQFYGSAEESISGLIDRRSSYAGNLAGSLLTDNKIAETARKSLVNRARIEHGSAVDLKKVLKIVSEGNTCALNEVEGLLSWCGGMKNVLALGKERMDHYARHLEETMVTYLQAISLNKSFRDAGYAVRGVIDVMVAAQSTADRGISDVGNFIKMNGIYRRAPKIGDIF